MTRKVICVFPAQVTHWNTAVELKVLNNNKKYSRDVITISKKNPHHPKKPKQQNNTHTILPI